jgi:predicted DNA-binding protein (MmcQ/YjbR family)
MFALTDINTFESINLKCDPDLAVEFRERYPAVLPGYHMNKKHWNTVLMDGSINNQLIRDWISQSYDLVAASLPKATREKYGLT